VIKPYLEASTSCARAPVRQSSRAICHQGRARRPQDHLPEVKCKLRSRRDLTMKWCAGTPRVSCVAPRGAFYAYPSLDIPEGDDVFVTELIARKHVMVVARLRLRPASRNAAFPDRFLPDEKRCPAPTRRSATSCANGIGDGWQLPSSASLRSI